MKRRTLFKASAAVPVAVSIQAGAALAENPVPKIGFVGVISGPVAACPGGEG